MKFVERHKRASEIVGGEWDLHEENTCEDTGFAVRDLPPIELLVNCIGIRFDHKSKMRDHPYAIRLSEVVTSYLHVYTGAYFHGRLDRSIGTMNLRSGD